MLGAPPRRVWREVDLPIVARAALVAAGFAFAISLGEFGATVFIVRPTSPTLPVLIYRLLGQPGPLSFGAAMAASVILMAITALAILAIERLRVGIGRRVLMLEVEQLAVRYGLRRRARRRRPHMRDARDRQRARTERQRQEHAACARSPGSRPRRPVACDGTASISQACRRIAASSA